MKLFDEYQLGETTLKNRVVMAPMTRSRAINNVPNDLMTKYYSLRSDAGLLITEATAISPNALGYARIPGIFSKEQIKSWKKVTEAVHLSEGKIFVQLFHTGRVAHKSNMPQGASILAPSSIAAEGEMWTDVEGMQKQPVPNEMTMEEIAFVQNEFVKAAENAIEAGFDGVEIHAANGYLLDQFINPASNKRKDLYGDSYQNRSRLVIETAKKVTSAIGSDKTGIRLSPCGVFNDMSVFDEMDKQFEYLAQELGKLNLVYIHIVDHSSMGAPEVTKNVKDKIKNAFDGTIIYSGGLSKEKAETILENNTSSLAAFGRAFLANPDLVKRFQNNSKLNEPDPDTFYTSGEEGYLNYPLLNEK